MWPLDDLLNAVYAQMVAAGGFCSGLVVDSIREMLLRAPSRCRGLPSAISTSQRWTRILPLSTHHDIISVHEEYERQRTVPYEGAR